MRLYLDTSLLVASLTREIRTAQVQIWLGAQAPSAFSISEWVVTEFSAALSIKMRMGQIDATQRATALAAFARLCIDTLDILPISGLHFRIAARFADQYQSGLRAADALHLALCADHGTTICTLDQRLGSAAAWLGVPMTLL